jgi:hypothetical protein
MRYDGSSADRDRVRRFEREVATALTRLAATPGALDEYRSEARAISEVDAAIVEG